MFVWGGPVAIILCCCIRFRIPRTKQEIEADFIRKKITKKFRKRLRMIHNSDMDEMDLKRALDRVRAEFKSDTESLAQSDVLSQATLNSGNYYSCNVKEDYDNDNKIHDYSNSFKKKQDGGENGRRESNLGIYRKWRRLI
mgnify:CR=1 FL=1